MPMAMAKGPKHALLLKHVQYLEEKLRGTHTNLWNSF